MADRHLISLCIAGTLLFVLVISLLVFIVVNFRNKQNQYYIEKQQLLIASLEEGERMMNQIAKEVHDNIGQLSHLLYMTLDKIEKTTEREKQIIPLNNARQLTNMIIDYADNIGNSLNSDYIKTRGLSSLIYDDMERIRSIGNMVCHIDFSDEIRPFHPDKELLIYRIAQEAIHNALKHSVAASLSISLDYRDNGFKMEIADNGIGFKRETVIKKGAGLNNMQARADLLKGELIILSEPGDGCCITLSIDDIATYGSL